MGKKVKFVTGEKLQFMCPGCERMHEIYYGLNDIERWNWNGSDTKPSITPSIVAETEATHCHSFVTVGKIRFLPDSTHALAGLTVELPDITGVNNHA